MQIKKSTKNKTVKNTKTTGLYSRKVFSHFENPHNYGRIEKPDGVGKVGNLRCGDVLWLQIRVIKDKKGEEVIGDIKFETFGCVAALATSSAITDLAKGKTLKQALQITKGEIVDSLDGLPPIKLHCSVLAADALIEAIYDYYKKNKRPIDGELEKRHQMIQKTEEATEERYHDWVALEEQMHSKGDGKKGR
jgi:nitrogen fixation NifU-like protein